jgi:acetyl esterase/lipase
MAAELQAALASLRAMPCVDAEAVMLAGHSAGGHLAAWLALNWESTGSPEPPPLAFGGVEGIYNASVWDAYQVSRWRSDFHCADWQTFGDRAVHPGGWLAGSPTARAKLAPPAGPVLLVHSPGDDWVQRAQASQLFSRLQPPARGRHRLDTSGACVQGEHPAVLRGASAFTLAQCMVDFLREARASVAPSRHVTAGLVTT